VHAPLAALRGAGGATAALAARTSALLAEGWGRLAPPEWAALPAVFEHGDFASPNVLIDGTDVVGAVDWEASDARGLPLADLAFFLAYAAGAASGARRVPEHVRAHRDAFIAAGGWAPDTLAAYARTLELPQAAVPWLWLLVWPRAAARLRARLHAEAGSGDDAAATERLLALWKDTLDHGEAVHARFS
jgi:aminoglycoside phosphotransferase (APT) family kinase protein